MRETFRSRSYIKNVLVHAIPFGEFLQDNPPARCTAEIIIEAISDVVALPYRGAGTVRSSYKGKSYSYPIAMYRNREIENDRDDAERWVFHPNDNFEDCCDVLGLEPEFVRKLTRQLMEPAHG